jgi:hypothetical protein
MQFGSIGRDTFIGGGTKFADFNLPENKSIRVTDRGGSQQTGMPVLGGSMGHSGFIGTAVVVYPARAIESDVALLPSDYARVIDRTVSYGYSDHFGIEGGPDAYRRRYPG